MFKPSYPVLKQTKICIFIFFILLNFFGAFLRAQDTTWTIQEVPFARGYLTDVFFVDENTGWAVGRDDEAEKGAIVYTIDGGDHWILQANPLEGILNSIYFVDHDTGYTVGQNWDEATIAILKTSNGGQDWEMAGPSEMHGLLENVHFTGRTEGWAVGKDMDTQETLILHTANGRSWIKIGHPAIDGTLAKIIFIDNHGWIIGNDIQNDIPILLHSDDRGVNWTTVDHPIAKGFFTDVSFVDTENGWISGREDTLALLLNTTDGGTTWTKCSTPEVSIDTNMLTKSHQNATIPTVPAMEKIRGILFLTLLFGFFVFILFLGFIPYSIFFQSISILAKGSSWIPLTVPLANVYIYRLIVIGFNFIIGVGLKGEAPYIIKIPIIPTQIRNLLPEHPDEFRLEQNYPNPFNAETTIGFCVKQSSRVVLKVYDLKGREVRTLIDDFYTPGIHHIRFNANGLASGIYVYRISMGRFHALKKMVLLE